MFLRLNILISQRTLINFNYQNMILLYLIVSRQAVHTIIHGLICVQLLNYNENYHLSKNF